MRLSHWSLPAAVLLWAGACGAQDTRHYDWLTQGAVSGKLEVQDTAAGTRRSSFEFNDRGRGPRIEEVLELDGDGVLQRYAAEGKAYMGAAVEESFGVEDGTARWRSTTEQGSAEWTGRAWYVPVDGTPEAGAALARALLRADGQRLALLPAGEARIQRLASETVRHAGERRTVHLYAVSGIGFTPEYVWLDEAGELFALAYGWMGLTPRGWAEVLPALQERQDAAEAEYHRALAKRVTHPLPASWCLVGVRVLDVDAGRLLPDAAVRVHDGIIRAVGAREAVDCADLRTLDGKGAVAMPGLWDMHGHLSLRDGLLNVAAGVLAVRDMANDHEQLMQVIADFDSASVVGTRVHRAGFIDQKSPYSAPTGMLAETEEQAVGFVDWYAERGYPQIKIYSSITPGWVPAIARAVHGHGMRLSGHIPNGMSAAEAVRAGFDEIQHVNMLFLNFLAGPDVDTRTPARFTVPGERGGTLDLGGTEVRDFIALLKQEDVVVDPTVAIFDSMFRRRPGEVDPSFAMVADHLPPSVQRGLRGGGLQIAADQVDAYRRSADAQLALLRALHEAGVTLVPGTDSLPGFGLHRELELYGQAGIPNADVLRLATIGAATVAGAANELGRIAPGMRAELVLLDGDPLKDLQALRRPVLSIRGTRFYRPDELYREVGVRPFVPSLAESDQPTP